MQDVWLECNKKLKKCSNEGMTFMEIFEKRTSKLDAEELQLFVLTASAKQLWLRRNTVVLGEALSPPAVVIRRAKEQIHAFNQATLER